MNVFGDHILFSLFFFAFKSLLPDFTPWHEVALPLTKIK